MSRAARFNSGGVRIEGLPEFVANLKRLDEDGYWIKRFTKSERGIAKDIAAKATDSAPGASAQAGHFARAIKGQASIKDGARIAIGGARTPAGKVRAAPAFWGRKAQGNWIGKSWEVGGAGGPYAINSTIASESANIVEAYKKAVDDITSIAWPDH